MADGLTMNLSGGDGLKAYLAKLQGQTGVLRAGLLEGATYPDGTPTAYIAALQEYGGTFTHPGGTPYRIMKNGKVRFVKKNAPGADKLPVTKAHTITIPPRPFMRTTVQKNSKRWAGGFAKLIKRQEYNYLKSLSILGEQVTADIKVGIATFSTPPNAASTVREKGFNAPLRDTGHMMRSVGYEVTE